MQPSSKLESTTLPDDSDATTIGADRMTTGEISNGQTKQNDLGTTEEGKEATTATPALSTAETPSTTTASAPTRERPTESTTPGVKR